MKILMLTPYLPYPPASGGQIRTLNLLKYLSKDNQITLISLYKNEKEKNYASHLKSYCNEVYLCKRPEKPWQIGNIFKSVFSALPFLIVRNYSSEAKKTIEDLLKKESFDVIHAETFYIMPHIPKTKIPILLVEQTIEYKVYLHFISKLAFWIRIPLMFDILKLKHWELFYWKKASLTATVSDTDRQIINELAPAIHPVVIPNGAGDEMFVNELKNIDISKPILLFVGNFYWLQNVEAAKYIIERLAPNIKKALPNTQFIIAGQNASQNFHTSVENGIEVVDIPPDDSDLVKQLYHKATLFIAPIFGPGGTRLKLLAAMASGLPVIASATGLEGLETVEGVHALTAANSAEFITKITQILSDKQLYNEIRANAYKLANKKYSWSSIAQKLEEVYNQIIQHNEDHH